MRNVKNTTAIAFSMLVVWSIPFVSIAEQRMTTFEISESGLTISFPMSQKENLEAERVGKVIEEINLQKRRVKEIWQENYELVESGMTINFPLSDEDASKARSRYQELVRQQERNSQLKREIENKFEVIEF